MTFSRYFPLQSSRWPRAAYRYAEVFHEHGGLKAGSGHNNKFLNLVVYILRRTAWTDMGNSYSHHSEVLIIYIYIYNESL